MLNHDLTNLIIWKHHNHIFTHMTLEIYEIKSGKPLPGITGWRVSQLWGSDNLTSIFLSNMIFARTYISSFLRKSDPIFCSSSSKVL